VNILAAALTAAAGIAFMVGTVLLVYKSEAARATPKPPACVVLMYPAARKRENITLICTDSTQTFLYRQH